MVPGANAEVALTDADRAAIAAADVLLLQLEIPVAVVLDAARAARAGRHHSPAQPVTGPSRCPDALIGLLDGVIVEPRRGRGAARRDRPGAARDHHPRRPTVPAPPGRTAPSRSPGFSVRVVDTTGAGDAFAGALAANWHRPPDERLLRANAAGALTATAAGAAAAPSSAQVDAFLTEQNQPYRPVV